jgi:hypothetical protein
VLREKVASVAKRYEEQVTANRKAGAGATAKGPEPEGKGSNHESYAHGSGKGKGKSKAKGGKQEKRRGNAFSTKKENKLQATPVKRMGVTVDRYQITIYVNPDIRWPEREWFYRGIIAAVKKLSEDDFAKSLKKGDYGLCILWNFYGIRDV